MKDLEDEISMLIGDEYDEIHVSEYLANIISNFESFVWYNDEQNILGDTYIGNILINGKTISVYYNILYELDEIELKKNTYK